jgi:toxin CcdB
MPQYDVFKNPGRNPAIPYVVDVQSPSLDGYHRRMVVPLVLRTALPDIHHPTLNPIFVIEHKPCVLHPLEMVSVPASKLGKPVHSLSAHANTLITAIDMLISEA